MDIELFANKLRLLGNNVDILDIQTLLIKSKYGYQIYKLYKSGRVAKSTIYDNIIPHLNSGLAIVYEKNKQGIISLDTSLVVRPVYERVDIYDNKIIVLDDGSNLNILDVDLNQLFPAIYSKIEWLSCISEKKYLIALRNAGNTVNSVSTWIMDISNKENILVKNGFIPVEKENSNMKLSGFSGNTPDNIDLSIYGVDKYSKYNINILNIN